MQLEELLIDETVVKFFDDYIENEDTALKELEFIIEKEIEEFSNSEISESNSQSCNLGQDQL